MKHLIEIITDTLLIILPADLLYLYFMGAWYDPIRAIEVTELVILWGAMLLGIWRVIVYCRI